MLEETGSPVKESPVGEKMHTLKEHIGDLTYRTDDLEKHLEKVLSPLGEGTNVVENTLYLSTCPLCDELNSLIGTVVKIDNQLKSILKRLQL